MRPASSPTTLGAKNKNRLKVAVLVSGNGGNLQAIINHVWLQRVPCDIQLVVSNVPSAYGLKRAQHAGIRTVAMDHRAFSDRAAFDQVLLDTLLAHDVEVVLLAGFMRILTNDFVDHFHGKMLNIHPSLLPDLKGLDTHERAMQEGRRYHGATIHYVTGELDSGPIVAQGRLAILEGESIQSLQQRVHRIEHQIYPAVLEWLAKGRLKLAGRTVYLDDRPLPPEGVQLGAREGHHENL